MSSLCIAGKNQVAVDVLKVAASRYRVHVLPVSSDDGLDGWQPSLRKAAEDIAVEVVDLPWAMSQENVCFLSLEYDRIVRPKLFSTDRLFNLHFSMLPKYRGCHTAIWPILNGEAEHGVTLHWIDEGMDTGPIVDQRSFDLDGMTAREAYFRCMDLGADLVVKWLEKLICEDVPAVAQRESEASTYYRANMDFSLKEIDPGGTVDSVIRTVRAFTFPEYQYPTFQGRSIVSAAEIAREVGVPGEERSLGPDAILLNLADGVVKLSFYPDG